MKRNLKTVISTIAAVAVMATSAVSFAATTSYPDVPSGATYEQAVTELTALGVIVGNEDGTFGPDKNVTRAEFTKMVVTMLGSSEVAAATAAAGKDTTFTDVAATHWAAGYITAGTSQGTQFITGMGDGTFAPDASVTYAQAMKMLVCSLGYETYAVNNGGWPSGYLTWGYNLEISSGVSDVQNETALTRAQCAQMIDNAIKAPICVVDGYTTQWNGTQTPNLVQKNDPSTSKKDQWECLLNYSHDAYVVHGRVTATFQTGDVKDPKYVNLNVEKADNYDGYEVVSTDVQKLSSVYKDNSNADNYLFTYAEMLLQKDSNDDIHVLSIYPAGTNDTVSFKTEDYADTKGDIATGTTVTSSSKATIYAYEAGSDTKTTSYKLDMDKINGGTEGGVYINGVQMTGVTSEAKLQDYFTEFVTCNPTGTVELIDSPDAGKASSDGYYDYVMISCYLDGVVDSINTSDATNPTLYFDEMPTNGQYGTYGAKVSYTLSSNWSFDLSDENKSFKFYDAKDQTKAIDPTTLVENDVLSLAFDPTKDLSDADFVKVLVSKDTVDGKVTSVDTSTDTYPGVADTKTIDDEYTINGTTYKPAGNGADKLDNGSEYLLRLDAFGRYVANDTTAASKKIGVLENVYKANGDQYYATIVGADAEKKNYTIKNATLADTYAPYVYGSGATVDSHSSTKVAVQNRVYEYSVSSSTGNVTIKDQQTAKGGANSEYKTSTSKIGSIKISDTITGMLDLSNYSDDSSFDTLTAASLEDGSDYTAYGYNKLTDGTYQFVLVMDVNSTYTYNTKIAVYSKSGQTSTDDNDNQDCIYVYTNGETGLKTLLIDDTYSFSASNYSEGDVLLCRSGSDGKIKEITKLMSVSPSDGYDALYTAATAASTSLTDIIAKANSLATTMNNNQTATDKQVKFYFGPIIDKQDTQVTLGQYLSGTKYSNKDEGKDIDLDSDCNFYEYNYKNRTKYRVSTTSKGAIAKTSIPSDAYIAYTEGTTAYDKTDKTIIDWTCSSYKDNNTSTYGLINFALVRTVDDNAKDVVLFTPSSTKNS